MEVQENYNIKDKHTFGIETQVSKWIEFKQVDELTDFIKHNPLNELNHLVIGSGSNLLFTQNFEGLIIKPNFQKIELVEEDDEKVIVKVGAGVIWDDFVQYCVQNQYWGTENLSLIPGCVGASPVQNVGAYGAEVKDVIYKVLAIHKTTAETRMFEYSECQFSYRNSFFKQSQEWIVVEVYFNLSVQPNPNIVYRPLNEIFQGQETIRIEDIRNVVIETRESKLPNPEEIGSAGSFFKNPVVSKTNLEKLQAKHPQMPFYPFQDNYKLAAGWLIDQLGWKGRAEGGAAVHKSQALVLINKNNAKGQDVLQLSQQIQADVLLHFGISLEPEVIIL